MRARKRQSGQALVAALATTALLFALAGGLAVAVSAALTGTGSTADPYLRDAQAASATAAIVATVGGGAGCPSAATVSTAFGLSSSDYSCDPTDQVVPGQAAMVPFQWSGTCASAPLAGTAHTALWLHAIRSLASFYVDGNKDGCSPGAGACSIASSTSGGPGHFYRIDDCNLAAFGTPFAHVAGPNGAVSVVRLAPVASFVSAPGSPYPVDSGAGPIASAALRGPGQPLDLVVGSRTTGKITIWWGRGDGTFSPGPSQPIPTSGYLSALTLTDLNGDGLPDLIVASFPNQVSVWIGDGRGNFSNSGQDTTVGAGPVGVVAGPLTSPDRVDLATANFADGTVSILRGTGGGGLSKTATTCDVQGSPTALAVVGSGGSQAYLAVAKTDGVRGFVTVYQVVRNGSGNCNGNGNISLSTVQTVPLASIPGGIASGRFTGSGQLDLAVTLPTQNQVQIFRGAGSGQFQAQAPFDTDGQQPVGVAAGDFDRSGGDGLAIVTAGHLSVLLRNRSRVFSILASGGGVFNEADLIWASPTHTNTLFFEGGLQ